MKQLYKNRKTHFGSRAELNLINHAACTDMGDARFYLLTHAAVRILETSHRDAHILYNTSYLDSITTDRLQSPAQCLLQAKLGLCKLTNEEDTVMSVC